MAQPTTTIFTTIMQTTDAPTTTAAQTTTVAPSTTAVQTTTVAPTTTAAPSTTAAQTTTIAPSTTAAQTTTVAPSTTAIPSTTVAQTTTIAPSTTVAQTTTIAPSTTVAQTTTIAPSTTVAQTTTIAPSTTAAQTTTIAPSTTAAQTTAASTTNPPTTSPAMDKCWTFDQNTEGWTDNGSGTVMWSNDCNHTEDGGGALRLCPPGSTSPTGVGAQTIVFPSCSGLNAIIYWVKGPPGTTLCTLFNNVLDDLSRIYTIMTNEWEMVMHMIPPQYDPITHIIIKSNLRDPLEPVCLWLDDIKLTTKFPTTTLPHTTSNVPTTTDVPRTTAAQTTTNAPTTTVQPTTTQAPTTTSTTTTQAPTTTKDPCPPCPCPPKPCPPKPCHPCHPCPPKPCHPDPCKPCDCSYCYKTKQSDCNQKYYKYGAYNNNCHGNNSYGGAYGDCDDDTETIIQYVANNAVLACNDVVELKVPPGGSKEMYLAQFSEEFIYNNRFQCVEPAVYNECPGNLIDNRREEEYTEFDQRYLVSNSIRNSELARMVSTKRRHKHSIPMSVAGNGTYFYLGGTGNRQGSNQTGLYGPHITGKPYFDQCNNC
jgi:hypothetical protein